MARRSGPRLSQADALAYIALYGSERKAARATGVSRTVLNEAARGVREGGSKTVGKIAAAVGDAVQETAKALSGLIQSLAGGQPGQVAPTGRRLVSEGRAAPGTLETRASEFQAQMARQGLNPDGTSAAPPAPQTPRERPEKDRLGRRITDEQWANYQALQDAYDAGSLSADQYERFAAMQLGGTVGPSSIVEDI